jgi:hypothetical protein
LDSNPYSIALGDGGVVVADAGANAVLMVDDSNAVSLIAVLPPTMHEFPAELLAAMGPPPGEEGDRPRRATRPPKARHPPKAVRRR